MRHSNDDSETDDDSQAVDYCSSKDDNETAHYDSQAVDYCSSKDDNETAHYDTTTTGGLCPGADTVSVADMQRCCQGLPD